MVAVRVYKKASPVEDFDDRVLQICSKIFIFGVKIFIFDSRNFGSSLRSARRLFAPIATPDAKYVASS
jgi:hypothetical protein